MPALQIGLNKPGSGPKGSSKPAPARRKPIFGEDDDDDQASTAQPTSKKNGFQEITTFDETSPSPSSAPANLPADLAQSSTRPSHAKPALKPKFPLQQHTAAAPNLSALRTQTQHTANVDASLFDYDAAYDALHSKPAKASSSATGAAGHQESLYMNDLLAAAEIRKRDQLLAKERLLQKEREAEGEEFKDKDMFVTEAYKAQQEEVKKAEEMEREREAGEAKRREKGMGMTNFYKSFMEQEEKKHQEMVDAAANATAAMTAGADEGERGAEATAEESDIEKAKKMKERGRDVVINEEGQVLDKRDLLSAGLNVAPKPKAADAGKPTGGSSAAQRQAPLQGNRGRGDAHKAMRERQTRMMETQLQQAAKRNAEAEAEDRLKIERAAKSQKTEGDISSARERYLQRKKEAAAAAARGD